jgi:hypothetical protein
LGTIERGFRFSFFICKLDGFVKWRWRCSFIWIVVVLIFAIELGINIPTGKIRFRWSKKYRMMKYCTRNSYYFSCWKLFKYESCRTCFTNNGGNIYYLNLSQDAFKLGGSSFNQTQNKIGNETPTIKKMLLQKHSIP